MKNTKNKKSHGIKGVIRAALETNKGIRSKAHELAEMKDHIENNMSIMIMQAVAHWCFESKIECDSRGVPIKEIDRNSIKIQCLHNKEHEGKMWKQVWVVEYDKKPQLKKIILATNAVIGERPKQLKS